MLVCPTVFLNVKRECIFVQGKYNKMVTSATPSLEKQKLINFFPHSQLQYKLCVLNNDYHYYITLPKQSVSCDVLGQGFCKRSCLKRSYKPSRNSWRAGHLTT